MNIYSKDDCKKYIEKLNDEYKDNHLKIQERDELISENNIEKRDVRGYHGREILELLQNADDAYQKSKNLGEIQTSKLDVKITYKNNVLTIANTGTYFDKDGIKAIVQGNNSSKKGKYIGSKGTGFRSILNWSKEIKIYSGNFKLRFSNDVSKHFFDTIKNEPQIKKQLDREKNLYVPILSYPEYIDDDKEYLDTTIEIIVDEQKIKDDFNVDKQLNNIDSKILLFLPNTNSINIETDANCIKFERERVDADNIINQNQDFIDSMSLITISKKVDNVIQQKEDYELFERTIKNKFEEDGEKKEVNLAIAIPIDTINYDNLHLYTFFPLLETSSPFNCVMHATYELSDQRNTISTGNGINKEIIKEQINFIFDIVEKYYVKNAKYQKALEILTPRNIGNIYNFKFQPGFLNFNVEDYFKDKLKTIKMFLTVNGVAISFNDNPLIIDNDFPFFIKGEMFNNLLQNAISKKAENLIKLIKGTSSLNKYEEDELCNKISQLSNTLGIKDRVFCYDWWETNYKKCLPNLLKDQNDQWITKGSECYFLDGEFSDMEIPNWIKIPSIDMDYQKELFKVAKNKKEVLEICEDQTKNMTIPRIISMHKIYSLIEFKYRDKSTIISALNSSIDSYEKSVDFVKWLWKYYKDDENWMPPNIQNTKYHFPSSEKTFVDSNLLYFGNEYKNNLSEKLFGENYQKFPFINIFDVSDYDYEKFKIFISKFGIKDYPEIVNKELIGDNDYKNYLKDQMRQFGITITYNLTVSLNHIENFDNIVGNLSTNEILKWIYLDINLRKELNIKVYESKSFNIKYLNRQYYEHDYNPSGIKNYLLYVLNNKPWIMVNGRKCSPKEIIIDLTSKNNQKFSSIIPVITSEYLSSISNSEHIPCEDLVDILNIFDFCKNVTDLQSNDFYGLLLKIPTQEPKLSIEMSRHIYRIIERKDFYKQYDESSNKKLFFKEGKLLTQKKEYIKASDIYLPSSLIVNKSKYNILDKGSRTNNEKFVEIFGCKEYDKKPIIQKDSVIVHPKNDLFQANFIEFKKYAKSYNDLNKEIEKVLPKLSITLVKNINITIDDVEENVNNNYVEIRDSQSKWYIRTDEEVINNLMLSTCIENIFSNIANTPNFEANKYGELFRSDKKGRDFLITKDFGSCDFVSEITCADDLHKEFISALQKIDSDFSLQYPIDFDNIDSDESLANVVKSLQSIQCVDINCLYEKGFSHIFNLTQYNQSVMNYVISQENDNYKNYLFTKALTNESLQSHFLQDWYNFKNYKQDEDLDNICDIEQILMKKFGNWHICELANADDAYKINYDKLNPGNKFADEIQNNDDVKQMIYFDNKNKFDSWLSEMMNKCQAVQSDIVDPYEKYRKVVASKKEIQYKTQEKVSSISKNNITEYTFTESKEDKKRKAQKFLGNKGELVIYNYLCSMYKKENVKPISEAFVTLGIIKAGLAKSGDYDIEYIDSASSEKYFVEVKSGDSNSFYITPNELDFAKTHTKYYKLFVVYNLDKEEPDFHELPTEFWNDPRYHQEEIIEKIHIKF